MQNWNRINNLTQILKRGNKIHIKKENRGKFTKSAKAAGHSVQEHARAVLNDPNATPLQKKRANFARNAAKWHRKHDNGGTIDSSNTFNGIKTTNNRPYDSSLISYINDKLRDGGMSKTKRAAVLANIIEESGGNPFAKGPGGFYGLLQWSNGRYMPTRETDTFKELDNQINYILQTEGNSTDKKSWTHGGKGSGYNSLNDAIKAFNENNLENSTRGFTLGYVRPAGGLDSLANRYSVAKQIYNNPKFYQKGGELIYTPFLQGEETNKGTYTPFIPEITSDYTPSFPVEPVRNYTPVEQASEKTEREVKTPEIDTSYESSSNSKEIEKPIVTTKSKYGKGEQSKFVKDMYTLYSKELSKRGLPTDYAKWLTAQDALETGWGKSIIGNNNFGNIQYFDDVHGNKYSFTGGTDKHADGTKYSARFVNFNNIEDYIKYKVGMLSNPNSKRYRNIFIGDTNGFADRMQASGYAESKTYGKALKDVFNTVDKYLK